MPESEFLVRALPLAVQAIEFQGTAARITNRVFPEQASTHPHVRVMMMGQAADSARERPVYSAVLEKEKNRVWEQGP